WLQSLDFLNDVFEIGFGQEIDVPCVYDETFAAQFDLAFRLFAGDVKHERTGGAQFIGNLQQQRALADSRIASDQNKRAGYDAAAENAIKLSDAGRNAHVVLRLDLSERNRGYVAR